MGPAYAFQPMSRDDLPIVGRWLATPEVVRWWGNPDEQLALVRGDLDHPDMDQFIVTLENRPFAYLQCYRLGTWNDGFGTHPAGTRGIDQFIGEPELIGCGHGAAFIRQFADHLLDRTAPRVVTDPDPDNRRAVRAYEKAGFVIQHMVDTPDGASLLMVRNP